MVSRVKKAILAASKKYNKIFPFWDWMSDMKIIYKSAPSLPICYITICESSDNFPLLEIKKWKVKASKSI